MRTRALKAVTGSGIDTSVRQGLQFLVMLILMRTVSPDDFGTVAVLGFFTSLAAVIVDGGLSTTLIQRQDINHADESTIFWLNAVIGLALAALLALTAGPLSLFFDKPVIQQLAWVAALTVLMSSLGAIHTALLVKKLDFRTLLYAGTAAAVLSGLLSIPMAFAGFGVWALAAQMLSMAALSTALLWLLHDWRPAAVFSLHSAKKLFGFGGFVLAANLIDTLYTRAYAVLIGRYIGLRDLGFYDRADNTKQLPVTFMTGILGRVALPMLSEAANEPQKLRRGMQVAIRTVMLFALPIMLGLAALADPLIHALFGAAWRPAVAPFRILCLAAALWPLHAINVSALLAQGRAGLVLRLEIPKKTLGVVFLVIGLPFGIEGVAWSQVAFSITALWINAYYANTLLGYGFMHQMTDIAIPCLAAITMGALLYWLSVALATGDWLTLLSLAPIGAAFYVVMIFLAKPPALSELLDILRAGRAHTVRQQ